MNYLDVTFYIDENNCIQYKSFTKPTDSKRFLRPQSFHPKTVFESVPYSQMIRTLERNSSEETKKTGMKQLKIDFEKSGYETSELQKIEERATEQRNQEETPQKTETLTFPMFYFEGYNEFKKIIHDSDEALQQIIGDTKIVMALKKNPSIGKTKNSAQNTQHYRTKSAIQQTVPNVI